MHKMEIYCDKPMHVGFSVRNLSGTVMYDFFKGYLKPKYYGTRILFYTDTDSPIIHIKTDNFYNGIKKSFIL